MFGQPQSREAKEISNYLTKFHNQDTRNRFYISESGNLVLKHVTREDKGSYVCKATNMVGSKSSEAAILSVHGKYKYKIITIYQTLQQIKFCLNIKNNHCNDFFFDFSETLFS